jgi:type III pantothenate kinase
MAWLLIDNSNTRTKLALGGSSGLGRWRGWLATPELSGEALAGLLGGVEFDGVLLCSVVPEKAQVMREFFGGTLVHELGAASDLGIGIDYPEPGQIGADRLANAVAVHVHFGAPAIVIDFGTAVTFDVVSAAGAYAGGVIAPGLAAMTDYLAKRTALLPRIELAEPRQAIGKSTEEAMQAGAVFGYRGLVKEILARLGAEISGSPAVIATGGDAELIARGLPEIHQVAPELTLEGLRLIAARNLPATNNPI